MMDAGNIAMIIVALIGVMGSILTNVIMNGKAQAVMESKLNGLIEEVKELSSSAVKIPTLEIEIEHLKEGLKELKEKIT